MAFTAETGAGLAAANSYVAVADADTYHSDRGNSGWTGEDAVKQAALIKATEYVDGQYRFRGTKATAEQALEWPRTGAADQSGHALTGVPAKVANAVNELALLALTTNLQPALDRGGMVASESVGSLRRSYFAGAPGYKVFSVADRLLGQLITEVYDTANPAGSRPPTPFYSPNSNSTASDAAGNFYVGMMDNDG